MVLPISVVIPAKNDAAMLDRCLLSLARQTLQPVEIIVVDNGSTDDTADVARRHGVTVISELRPGITAAASRGYDEATGEIIARCDADSVLARDWLARIAATFERRPELGAVTGGAIFYDLPPVADWLARVLYLGGYFLSVGAAVANPPLFGSNFAMRRSLWQQLSASVPRDQPELHDDFDLSYRIPPDVQVGYDRTLRVGISGRPFRDSRAFRRRLRMAGTTLREHLPEQLPHRRWRRRLLARR